MFDSILEEEDFNIYFNQYKAPKCCRNELFYSIQINDHEFAFMMSQNQKFQVKRFLNDNYKQVHNTQIDSNLDIQTVHSTLITLSAIYKSQKEINRLLLTNYSFLQDFAQGIQVNNPFQQPKVSKLMIQLRKPLNSPSSNLKTSKPSSSKNKNNFLSSQSNLLSSASASKLHHSPSTSSLSSLFQQPKTPFNLLAPQKKSKFGNSNESHSSSSQNGSNDFPAAQNFEIAGKIARIQTAVKASDLI
ncbi:hypothetical protein SS50377_26760 [Spironucleus salmonicida]|uniref:Uncharacterized protein n=1 Tax=Spironucleus salmonicida TaxID=348837 RepID=V6M733_9EUKA|nr:hypothetical protein SS50377_26760 [Spironucleus salmonicida]|eukprot:EST49229.1 Hypothetical protein SS50377_ja033 [Spironucleus salmonicida]